MSQGKNEHGAPYGGFHQAGELPPENAELTRVGPGTSGGNYMRRFWHPVALSSELTDLPLVVRILGEDLVLFRDLAGRIGLLHRHCSHRGVSLEFGIPAEKGIRCCYHGWQFDIDGTILDTPGEPPDSTLKEDRYHGAYPAFEYKGLVFAYLGPPEKKPDFPMLDTYELADNRMIPYSISHPCNWLQVFENMMDPIHAVFLHTRLAGTDFTEAWGEMPVLEFGDTEGGMLYTTSRRCGDWVWVRSNHIMFPNCGQTAALWEDADIERRFTRVSITRWTVPIDDTNCYILGWRHFNKSVDPKGYGDESLVGKETVDFAGQTGHRSYEEKQRNPGDWDAQVAQRPIAIHDLEYMGLTDIGVAKLRNHIRRGIRAVDNGEAPKSVASRNGEPVPTYTHDTVMRIPPPLNGDDEALLTELGRKVTEIILGADAYTGDERQTQIETKLRELS
jgi:phenylpropionate dioxygenase-like ring-hydroxylating dioxygenase large terminal subunit